MARVIDDLKVALRSLLATPGPTAVVVLTLAVAVGANTAVFSVVSGVLLRPLGYGGVDEEQLVVPWATASDGGTAQLSPADYRDLRDQVDAFDGMVGLYRFIGSTLTGLDEPVRVGSMTATPRLFRVLGARTALGALFAETDERPGGGDTLLLTFASWRERFGADPAIVGSSIEIDSRPFTVVGVLEEGFRFPPGDAEVEIFFPMRLSDAVLLDRNHRMFDGVARLRHGVGLEAAREELAALGARLAREYPDTNEGWGLTARPLREEIMGEVAPTLRVLSAAVFLVLLTACANIANLLVARSSATAREYAVRAALGAGAGDLGRRSLVESCVLGLAGGGLGRLLAGVGTRWLRTVVPADIPRADTIALDAPVLAFGLLLSLGAAVLFGALPALRAATPDLVELLKPGGSSSGGRGGGRRTREAMVVVEVALACVLLVAAGLTARSFARLSEVDPGFRRDGVLSVAVQLTRSRYEREQFRTFFVELVERARELPGVHAAGAVSDLPMSPVGLGMEMEFSVPEVALPPSVRPNADFRLMLPGYFDAMGMEVVSGRDVDVLDTAAGRVGAIVNETLVDLYFPDLDPVGRKLQVPMLAEVEILGVVSDIRHDGLQGEHQAEVYLPYGPITTAEMHLVLYADGDPGPLARSVSDVLREMDPELAPSSVATIAGLLRDSVAGPRFNTTLLAALAACAALLAAVGTYGVVAYSVSRRTTEIGIRMALGADASATVGLVVRGAVRLVALGAVLGTLGSLAASRFLRGMLHDVAPTDPLTYAGVLIAALVLGTVAAWTPARRATRIDPVDALRGE